MLRLTEIRAPLGHAAEALSIAAAERLAVAPDDILQCVVARRGHDARKKSAIQMVYTLDVAVRDESAVLHRLKDDPRVKPKPDAGYRPPPRPSHRPAHRPVVVGAGPCGLFAALILAEAGLEPVVLDRGKPVRERTKDTWGLWRRGELNPESNVQFGEGGAGTFSDGKLYSQIRDPRNLGRKVLQEFVAAGAPTEILTEAHPHIGTFRLVGMVERIRAKIEALGGEYRFQHRVEDLDIAAASGARRLRGLHLSEGRYLEADHVVLALGHSARDTFQMLLERGVHLEAKPFSIGFRIEHPQSWIDRARFGACAGHPDLGAAAYSLAHHAANGRTVYSFCMCPGGTVVAAASEPGRVATNGMSQYSRNERNANAGIVVGVTPEDYPEGMLGGIALQRHWEAQAFVAGGGGYAAPGQRVGDFLAGRPSQTLGEVVPSYRPGVTPADLSTCLPDYAIAAIREALPVFGRQIGGFDAADAVLTGVETRTSSPVRLTRGDSFESLNLPGLFPAGEGAGYAGGILSAAVDGVKVGEAVARRLAGVDAVSTFEPALRHGAPMERVFGDFPWVLRTPLPEFAGEAARVRRIVLAEHRAWVAPDQQFSFPIRSQDPFFDALYERFLEVCRAQFEPFTLHPSSRRTCFSYVQTDRQGASVWHDHLLTSTINGVYYLAVPDPAAQLWFLFRDMELRATPEEGWLYLFPRWLVHKPVAQRSPFPRISLNVELISHECPIDRDGGARW